jgi:hypothetical protein
MRAVLIDKEHSTTISTFITSAVTMSSVACTTLSTVASIIGSQPTALTTLPATSSFVPSVSLSMLPEDGYRNVTEEEGNLPKKAFTPYNIGTNTDELLNPNREKNSSASGYVHVANGAVVVAGLTVAANWVAN